MAWPGQVDAEKLLGMKPEELKEKLDKSATKEDLTALSTAQGELKTSLFQIQEALKKLSTPPPADPGDPEDPIVANLTDPAKFIDSRLKPIADASTETQAQVQEMRARQNPQFSGVFAQYGDELMESAKKMPAQMRAGDNFWPWHIRTVLGDKFIKGELKGNSYPTLIGSSSVGPNVDGKTGDPNHGLDPEVAGFLKDRGITAEKAAKIKHLMGDQGEPISLANYKGAANA